MTTDSSHRRLLSLDVMRGITVVGMIVVNNAGGPMSYDSLRHSAWNGLTPCDLVFPFFLFIVGVTTYLSLSKSGFTPSWPVVRKILWRAAMIIIIGWALHWVELAFKGTPWAFDRLRLTGVLPRIGLCFGAVSLYRSISADVPWHGRQRHFLPYMPFSMRIQRLHGRRHQFQRDHR